MAAVSAGRRRQRGSALNISRETTQDRAFIAKLSRVLTRRFIKFLEEEAKDPRRQLQGIFTAFWRLPEEGAALDATYKDELMKLLRYDSSLTKAASHRLRRLRFADEEGQKEIIISSVPTARPSGGPYLEGFRARNLEVLFCYENVDEYVMTNVHEFDASVSRRRPHGRKLEDLPKPPRKRR